MTTISQALRVALLRPYISRELPGWGRLYDLFIGDYRTDEKWKDGTRRWVRGKLHGYEMSLDLGYWSNRHTFFLKRFYDLPTQLLLMNVLRSGDTFVDIGANEGMISLLASRLVGASGTVITFEPNPAPRGIFNDNIARNRISNITVHAKGLGSRRAVMILHVPSINTGEGSFGVPDYSDGQLTSVEVEVAQGDEELASHHPAAIKIDVEGFEMEVLQGLSSTLDRCHPVVITEIVPTHLSRSGSSPDEISDFMKSKGYSPSRLGLEKSKLSLTPEWPANSISGDYVWQRQPVDPA